MSLTLDRGVAVARAWPEVVVALAAAAYVVGGFRGWGGDTAALVVGNTAMIGLPVLGGGLAVVRGAQFRGRARVAWVCVGLSGVLWGTGQAMYAVHDLVLQGAPPFPGPPDVGYIAALAVLVVGVVMMPGAPTYAVSRLWFVMDAILVALAIFGISWTLVLAPIWASGDSSGWAKAVALYYPAGDVVVAALTVTTMMRAHRGGDRSLLLLAVAVGALFTADMVYAVMSLHGTYTTGMAVDAGWWAAYLLVGIAARAYEPERVPVGEHPVSGMILALPSLLVLPMVGVLSWASLGGRLGWPAIITGAVAVTTLVLRQGLANWDSARLTLELAVKEGHFRHLAHHDPLTGLCNRVLFRAAVDAALREAPYPDLILLDLDGFKNVNDTLGHPAGDAVLVAVARRLENALRKGDLVARLGGDEFAVLLELGSELPGLPERVEGAVAGSYNINGAEVSIGASIGVARGHPGDSADELLRNADLAMYEAKNAGRAAVAYYEPRLHVEASRRFGLAAALRVALDEGQFRLHFQPVVDLDTMQTVGAEALVRWERPAHGLVPPLEFLGVAEDSGLLLPLGAWMFRRACRQAARWGQEGVDAWISVNVSPRQVRDPDLSAVVSRALQESGLPPDRLVVEITENALLSDVRDAMSTFAGLRELGIRLALDDFGTGFSSLSHLSQLKVDLLKIDRTFVKDIAEEPEHRILVDTIATLAHKLGLEAVAEGIETAEQAHLARELGVPLAQGFLYGRPMPAEELRGWWAAAEQHAGTGSSPGHVAKPRG